MGQAIGVVMKERDMAEKNLILKVQTGSHLYGTNTPDSDRDYIGIFIPNKEYVLGLERCEQVEFNTNPSSSGKKNTKKDVDCILYSLSKFIHLAIQNNPNILEVLFTPQKNIIHINEYGRRLLQAAPFFVSRRIEHTFLGYAHSQRYKLENKKYEGTRQELVNKYGYDVKYAYHLLRLLKEGWEIARNGNLKLPLQDKNFLQKVKTGQMRLEEVLRAASVFEKEFKQELLRTRLPKAANRKELNKLQIQLFQDFWK